MNLLIKIDKANNTNLFSKRCNQIRKNRLVHAGLLCVYTINITLGLFTKIILQKANRYNTRFIFTALFVVFSFTVFSQTKNVITDKRDGKTYGTIKIGNQTWMSENMNYIPKSGSWCYNDSLENCKKYGRLYTWEAAKQACAEGWRLPTDSDWTTLIDYLGGDEFAGAKLRSTTGWNKSDAASKVKCGHAAHKDGAKVSHDSIVTNSSSFTALPGGGHYFYGNFDYSKEYGLWWSATEYNVNQAWYFYLINSSLEAQKYYSVKLNGYSVRCVKE